MDEFRVPGVPGVNLYHSNGKLYAYHRSTGKRIREPFGTAAFMAEVEAQKAPPVQLRGLAAQKAISAAVLKDRESGVPWKVLTYKYGKSKTRLLELLRAAKNSK